METQEIEPLIDERIDYSKVEFIPVETKNERRKKHKQLNVIFTDADKYLTFRRYCKARNINMSSLVRKWVNEAIDEVLNSDKK